LACLIQPPPRRGRFRSCSSFSFLLLLTSGFRSGPSLFFLWEGFFLSRAGLVSFTLTGREEWIVLFYFSGASSKKKKKKKKKNNSIFLSFLSIRVPLVWCRSASLKETVLPLLQDPGSFRDFLDACVFGFDSLRSLDCLVRQRL